MSWEHVLVMIAALGVDRLVGDPRGIPHPVIAMGTCIAWLERTTRPLLRTPTSERVAGALLVALVVGACYAATLALVAVGARVHPALGFLVAVWITSTTVASRGLEEAAHNVAGPLAAGDLPLARSRVAEIVGRDTESMDEPEVARAAVETVAENTVDACVAPLFFAALGGAPLAVAYRCVNTFDSMWGYKNDRFRHFGWAAARLDDVANWIPARVHGMLLPFAAWLTGADGRAAWRVMRRDAKGHPSPNAGIAEAGVAGALGIRLGGWNTYQGERQFRAYLGDEGGPATAAEIARAVRLMHAGTLLFVGAVGVALWASGGWPWWTR